MQQKEPGIEAQRRCGRTTLLPDNLMQHAQKYGDRDLFSSN
jgi:hypothetical protein